MRAWSHAGRAATKAGAPVAFGKPVGDATGMGASLRRGERPKPQQGLRRQALRVAGKDVSDNRRGGSVPAIRSD